MATLTKEESEQMAELLGKLGIREPAGIETLIDLTKVLPKVKRKRKRSRRKDYLSELTTLRMMMRMMRKAKGKTTVLPN